MNGFSCISSSPKFPADPEMFAINDNNIYFSPDEGQDWCQALYDYEGDTSGSHPLVISFANQVYMAPNFKTSHLVVISGPTGNLYRATVAFYSASQKISEDDMVSGDYPVLSASEITPPTPMGAAGSASGGYYAFAFGPNDSMYVSNGSEIYKSTNVGWSWTLFRYTNDTVYGLAVSPNYAKDGTLLYAAGGGVWMTKDGGKIFEKLSSLPGVSSPYTIAFSRNYATDGKVGVSIPGDGLYLSTDRVSLGTTFFPILGPFLWHLETADSMWVWTR